MFGRRVRQPKLAWISVTALLTVATVIGLPLMVELRDPGVATTTEIDPARDADAKAGSALAAEGAALTCESPAPQRAAWLERARPLHTRLREHLARLAPRRAELERVLQEPEPDPVRLVLFSDLRLLDEALAALERAPEGGPGPLPRLEACPADQPGR